ncbi:MULTISPECIES: site-specific integrase [Bacillati]|uniref:site-specific integrase n=1 Tax=Bacillati TaxID=1783272 RepID=UPI0022B9679F|nr:site-specific integrase [Caldifermentibacillus hisashii]
MNTKYLQAFIKHIEDDGYSQETVISYEKVINQFTNYLYFIFKKDKDPIEINPSDIKNYLNAQINNGKNISTVNKELAILRTFFNYLWEKDIVKIDPTVKIKHLVQENRINVEITYDEIVNIRNKVLMNNDYSPMRKSIYLLATKGLKTSDYRFKKSDVTILDNKNPNQVEIRLKHRSLLLDGVESDCFLDYYFKSIFYDSDYVFTTKNKKSGERGPVQVMTLLNHLRAISNDYFPTHAKPLTLISIRKALAYNLYTKEKKSIQYIANLLGIEESSASNYLKKLSGGSETNI